MDDDTLTWFNKDGELHREGGPAYIEPNKIEKWFKNGKLHRVGGPAKITFSLGQMRAADKLHPNYYWGMEKWFFEGKLHREGAPAVILGNGIKKWHCNGVLHRDDGPAVEYPNGAKEYWIKGNLHREGAPAMTNEVFEAWFMKGKLDRGDGPALIFYPKEEGALRYGHLEYAYRINSIVWKFCSVPLSVNSEGEQWWKRGKRIK